MNSVGGLRVLTHGSHHNLAKARVKPVLVKPAQIRILLVDDHPAVRLGARKLIEDQPDMRVVAEARGAGEALGRRHDHIDVAIVDYQLGEGRDGLWLTTQLKRRDPATRVLVYSAFVDGALAVAALIAGADGLLGKHELHGADWIVRRHSASRPARGGSRPFAETDSVYETDGRFRSAALRRGRRP